MKILYFGTVCDPGAYDRFLINCKHKPSVAPLVFETALLDGFKKNGANVEIHSFPMIPTFPLSRYITFGGFTERLSMGYDCHWLRTWNIPVLKQWSRRIAARRAMKQWGKENAGIGVLLTYSIPPFMAKDMLRIGRKYNLKTVAIVPDLPANMYQNHKGNLVLDWFRERYLVGAMKYQANFDGYIYLSEAMSEAVAPGKPYLIMEGILNDVGADIQIPKAGKRAVMYAGRLHTKYGVLALVDSFQRVNPADTELWLFGDGSAADEIKRRSECDNRIRYFGRVSRQEVLKRMKEATLLVNPRSTRDAFTRYSFPSKTIEYMYSGTPLLSTRLEGIPEEYFNYMLTAEDNREPTFDCALRQALSMTDEELSHIGERARQFIATHKNAKEQSRRTLDFLYERLGDCYENGKKEDI